jgi:serine/threonine protein kinase
MKLLSYGSFSTIYEGDDDTVYKFLDEDAPKIELDLLPSLNHKNVITSINVNFDQRCIKMKKYPITLGNFIKTNDYTIDNVKDITLQLFNALQYLESNRIVNCDIKPSNIMIDPKTMNVKLIDFGLSFIWDKKEVTFKRKGNWSYMSPQVCCQITVKDDPYIIDRFSLSMVVYKLLTGKKLLKWKDYIIYKTINKYKSFKGLNEDDIAYHHIQAISDNLDHPPLKWISNLPNDKVKLLIQWSIKRNTEEKRKRFMDNLKQHSRFKYDDILKEEVFKNLFNLLFDWT